MAAKKKSTVVKKTTTPAAPEGWTATPSPSAAALRKKPIGTAYLFFAPEPSLGPGAWAHVFWKQAANTWFQSAQPTVAAAWTAIGNNLQPFQATPDAGMAFCLRPERVTAGLFERLEASPPFKKRA
ncbi:MAG: hypothetical protein U0228_26985 [Myxococcaceae bacterium]